MTAELVATKRALAESEAAHELTRGELKRLRFEFADHIIATRTSISSSSSNTNVDLLGKPASQGTKDPYVLCEKLNERKDRLEEEIIVIAERKTLLEKENVIIVEELSELQKRIRGLFDKRFCPCDFVLQNVMEFLFDEYCDDLVRILSEISITAPRLLSLVRFKISVRNWYLYGRDHPDWKTTSPRHILDLFRLSDLSSMPYALVIEFAPVSFNLNPIYFNIFFFNLFPLFP